MQLIKKDGIFIFWVLLFAHCAFIYFGKTEYRHITKLLLIPLLITYLVLNARKNAYQHSKAILYAGLVFSFLGDLFLIYSGKGFFIAGMVAFMLTHICYTTFFLKAGKIDLRKATEFFIAAIIVTLIGMKLLQFLKPYLGEMELPVKIYTIVICLMTASAANLLSSKSMKVIAAGFFVPGAALFMLSDSVLALNHFIYKDAFLNIVVMLTYGYAQCLLVQGFTRYLKV
ncbi:MAG: lysoplasmalogenase [Sphingobacteriia bacterium]|nr:lysoplasmalogenase [Sphingobacteriia bacterium]